MDHRVVRDRFYPGSDIPITAGLFTLECENGHTFWHLTPTETCPTCGARVIKGLSSYYKENERTSVHKDETQG